MSQPNHTDTQNVTVDEVINSVIGLAHADTARHIRERAILSLQIAQYEDHTRRVQEELAAAHAEISRLNALLATAGETVVNDVLKDAEPQPAQT